MLYIHKSKPPNYSINSKEILKSFGIKPWILFHHRNLRSCWLQLLRTMFQFTIHKHLVWHLREFLTGNGCEVLWSYGMWESLGQVGVMMVGRKMFLLSMRFVLLRTWLRFGEVLGVMLGMRRFQFFIGGKMAEITWIFKVKHVTCPETVGDDLISGKSQSFVQTHFIDPI